jgi:hypothetical protein
MTVNSKRTGNLWTTTAEGPYEHDAVSSRVIRERDSEIERLQTENEKLKQDCKLWESAYMNLHDDWRDAVTIKGQAQ